MIKHLTLFAFAFFLSLVSFAATGDTTIIVAHHASNLAGPPSNDDEWVVFANTNVTYQKIIMRFTLGCGTPACSHWDYTVNTELGKKSGTLDSSIVAIDTMAHDTTWSYTDHVNFTELGRLITPYGNYMDWNWPSNQAHGFDSSWTHPYIYDVTDYASMFKDSVLVRVHYDGWSDAFRAKVEYIFIEGPPTRTVENVREVYHSYYGYGNSTDFENQLTGKSLAIGPNVTSAKLAVIITGHGNQGEFDPHSFYLKVNSVLVHSKLFWKDDCDVNPVAPQGGTWIFPRANWCPGDK
ncbi:MAG TPA: peptide-N-glycosidase F-related protein, partial [Chitinophagales bacterium]|nr:peptide-N-glycosidase F-related protein [Chitinophagales bacterium]